MINPYRTDQGSGYQRPLHGRVFVETMLLLGLGKQEEKERRKAIQEAAGTVEEETHSHKGGHFKYRNIDWKGES